MTAFKKDSEAKKDGVIRRVIKQDNAFICGLCGKRHAGERSAEACLAACSQKLLQNDSPQAVSDGKAKRYRCSFCKRIYDSTTAAKDCARACKGTIQKRLDAEVKVKSGSNREEKLKTLALYAGQEAAAVLPTSASARPRAPAAGPAAPSAPPAPSKRPSPSVAAAAPQTHACSVCSSSYASAEEARGCASRHRPEAPAAAAPAPAVAEAGAAAPAAQVETKEGPTRAETKAKFFRDGAKYVCRNCSKKYFTQSEVIACFDGHPPPVEEYVTGRSAPGTGGGAAGKSGSGLSDKEIFFRDGAKYVCKSCKAKYFTRTEVVACFDGHS